MNITTRFEQNLCQKNHFLIKNKNTQKHPYVKAVSEKGITYTDEFRASPI